MTFPSNYRIQCQEFCLFSISHHGLDRIRGCYCEVCMKYQGMLQPPSTCFQPSVMLQICYLYCCQSVSNSAAACSCCHSAWFRLAGSCCCGPASLVLWCLFALFSRSLTGVIFQTKVWGESFKSDSSSPQALPLDLDSQSGQLEQAHWILKSVSWKSCTGALNWAKTLIWAGSHDKKNHLKIKTSN